MAFRLKAIPESLTKSIEQTKVQYRRLGNSGLRISNPVLGAMSFGDPQWLDWVLNEEKVRQTGVIMIGN
jgi:hypothetical protein